MNVTCTGCPAKYAVPDEKVRGKKVRITCKHCGTGIVVDGTTMPAVQSAESKPSAQFPVATSPASTPEISSVAPALPSPEAPALAPELSFVVGFPDDRQEPHTLSDILDMYVDGRVDDEALVWRDGMSDWLALFEVPEIAAAFRARGLQRRIPRPPIADDEPTVVGRSPLEDEEVLRRLTRAAEPAVAEAPAGTENPLTWADEPAWDERAGLGSSAALDDRAGLTSSSTVDSLPSPALDFGEPFTAQGGAEDAPISKSTSSPLAARRADKRAGAVDLFGSVADAGSEHDTSFGFGAADESGHKLTGARNESSVLFSLDALTNSGTKANQKKAREDEAEKHVSDALFGDTAPDSLMNLGGGGLAALAAPDFTKPVSAVAEPARSGAPVEVPTHPPVKNKGGVILLLASMLGIAAIAGLAFVMMKKAPAPKLTEAPEREHATVAPAGTPEGAAVSGTSSADAPSAGALVGAPVASAAPGAGAEVASAKPTETPPPWGQPSSVAPPVNKAAEAPSKKPDAPAASAQTAEAAPAAPPPALDAGSFDKNAAVAALGAAAANAPSCKSPDGPTGTGKVSVTFAPSGRATATSVAGALAGTEVGGCVARLFRSAKVPPFSGDPVTVAKSFSVE